MFCPTCGNNCMDSNFCPNCGHDLRNVIKNEHKATLTPKIDLNYYYEKYPSDKEAAMVALRADTGMSAFEALQAIDSVFSEHTSTFPLTSKTSDVDKSHWYPGKKKDDRKAKIVELEKSGQVYCPKCLSTSISGNKKGFGIGKAVVGAGVFGAMGLTAGNINAKKVICTCLKCGYQWKSGKK